MILNTVLFWSVLMVVYAQYPDEIAPAPPRRRSAPPPQEEPEYRVAPRQRSPVFNPAAVHYVNIGAELAGDYKFGYDTGKGQDGQSFREETRLPDGSVKGAYGYVDASGKQRIVKYSAGKDGYKVEGDPASERATSSRSQAQQAQPPPAQSYSPPQETYAPPRPVYRPPAQSYTPPQQSYRQQEEDYNPPQPAYRPPQESYNPPQPAYRAPPPASRPVYYAPPQQASRQAPPRSRLQPETYDYDDYDSPSNELNEPRIRVPIDTTLFNYNIGINPNKS